MGSRPQTSRPVLRRAVAPFTPSLADRGDWGGAGGGMSGCTRACWSPACARWLRQAAHSPPLRCSHRRLRQAAHSPPLRCSHRGGGRRPAGRQEHALGKHGLRQGMPLKSPFFPIIYPRSDDAERRAILSGQARSQL